MKLNAVKNLSGGVFKVDVEFKSYEIYEQGLMEDFGVPELIIPVSTWGAKVSVDTGEFKFENIKENNTEGDCKIEIADELIIKLDNTFKATYSIKISDLDEGELNGKINSVVKLAEVKCALFVAVIQQEGAKLMTKLRAMKTDFEAITKNPTTIKI